MSDDLCNRCGVGFYLPSGVCDHCDWQPHRNCCCARDYDQDGNCDRHPKSKLAQAIDDMTISLKESESRLAVCLKARKARLNQGLLTLASWAQSRATGEHDEGTTLTMLARKVGDLNQAVQKAGWHAVEQHEEARARARRAEEWRARNKAERG